MNLFAINIVLAVAWVALTGANSISGLLTGFLLGLVAMWVVRPLFPNTGTYFRRLYCGLRLIVMFIYELAVSSIAVAKAVVSPGHNYQPALIEVPLTVKTDLQIMLVANFITLTPGTLTLDVSEDRTTLYLHSMFGDDPDGVRDQIRDRFEVWVREATE
ncbi:Na+/H+ antiporter subunit E [Paracoccus sp. (in: a-proteobacteria)]|uniref:Na+/H+ antiporter subunit E n=1 Tax=Paracoccus sp. TaxID=267 RepID=UPI0026DF8252|nr:Na+/H+ antiporter subunit E [Paracoccus sp. (in: a-proteobacteria)]MDO5646631.1 Na+/H+ antiporter subunit E [Paracoccus sp. (in: a-proteobacteria)]